MPYYCTVPQCTSMAGKAKNVSFHQFPRDTELADQWNLILKRGKPYTKYSKVCSLHFTMDDYTVTSVGKNKGQWRTLRKDAIPSQKLPKENPPTYRRSVSNQQDSVSQHPLVEPQLQHHLAQAIYMQTMLAIHAANYMDKSLTNVNNQEEQDSVHSTNSETQQVNTASENNENTPKPETNWYKCSDCTKCFKDPDVLTIHKRSHNKEITNCEDNNREMLNSNPILSNLLLRNNENKTQIVDNFESNNVTLAAHMQFLFRNLANYNNSKGDNEANDNLNESSDSDRLVINESV